MEIKGKNVLVFGSGISGIAACKLLLAQQAQVILYDGNTSLDPEALKEKTGEVQVILGDLSKDVMESLALVVLSPGVPTDLPVVEEMKALQIPIWGEVELAYVYGKRGCTGNYGNQRKDHDKRTRGSSAFPKA